MLTSQYQRYARDQRCDGYADGYKAGRADKLLGQSSRVSQPSDIGYFGRYARGYIDGQRSVATLPNL